MGSIELQSEIFKKYDIRGTYGINLSPEIAYTIGRSYGSYIQQFGRKLCVVGQDNRISSPILTDNLMLGLLSTGIDVVNLGIVTTPMLYYACIRLNTISAAMVSASHNPKEDNGFKFNFDDRGNSNGKEIAKLRDFTYEGNFIKGKGNYYSYDIANEYIELMMKSISLGPKKIKVVLDLGNATTSVIARRVFERFDIDFEILFEESDPNVPNHLADPSVESNMEALKKRVIETHADLGIAYDADGDRLGVVDENGHNMAMDKYMIIIIRDLYDKVKYKKFAYDVKCSKALEDEIIRLGCTPVEISTGNIYSKATLKYDDISFGGELSGHIFFGDRFPRIDDGIYGSLRLIEILSKTDKTCSELLEGINVYQNTPEVKFPSNNTLKFEVIENMKAYCLKKGYKCSFVDGVKAKFDDGWVLIRASNTGPDITARFEAKTVERLNELKEEFVSMVDYYNQELEFI